VNPITDDVAVFFLTIAAIFLAVEISDKYPGVSYICALGGLVTVAVFTLALFL